MDRVLHYLNPTAIWQFRAMLLQGLGVTLALSGLTLVISILPALAIALGRRFGPRWLARPLTDLIWLARGVPAVMMVVFIYLALPFIGPAFSAFTSALIAMVITQVVYFSEVFRGALAAIGRGQFDAGNGSRAGWKPTPGARWKADARTAPPPARHPACAGHQYRAPRYRPGRARGPGPGCARPLRWGQIDPVALREPVGTARCRHGHVGRHRPD